MEVHGSSSTNPDKSQNLTLEVVKGDNDGAVAVGAFVEGYKDGDTYNAVGAKVCLKESDFSASLSAQHVPEHGKEVAAAANINLVNNNDNKLDLNVGSKTSAPKCGPVYSCHELGLNYQNKDLSANLSAQHNPTTGTQANVATKLNLLNTNEQKMDVNAFVSRDMPKLGPEVSLLGGGLNYQSKDLAANLSAQHNSLTGTQARVATDLNLLNINDQKLTANVFTSLDMPKNGPNTSLLGGGLNYQCRNNTASLLAQHNTSIGSEVTAAARINLLDKPDHKVNVNAFTQLNKPIGGPSFTSTGGGIDYQFKDRLAANASVLNRPSLKQQDYNLTGGVNLFRNQNLSIDLNAGATRTDTSFGSGKWRPGGSINLVHKF